MQESFKICTFCGISRLSETFRYFLELPYTFPYVVEFTKTFTYFDIFQCQTS